MEFSINSKEIVLSESREITHPYPVNLNAADTNEFAGRESYTTYRTVLQYLGTARVSSASVIYKNWVATPASLYLGRNHFYFQTRHLAKKLLRANKIRLDTGTKYLLATDQESEGHYHWLTEVLPRLWLIRQHASRFHLLLPDRPYIRSVGLASLALLGIDFAGLRWMRDDEFYTVPTLYRVSNVALSGHPHDDIIQELRSAFTRDFPKGKRRIYVSRKDARRRLVLNDDELIEMLKGHGFEVFTGEGMSLEKQIQLFSQCSVLIGMHGAGLTNSLFMPSGSVIELKKREPTIAYWHLAASLGHKYYYFNGVPDSDESLIGTGCNLTIPVYEFEQMLLNSLRG